VRLVSYVGARLLRGPYRKSPSLDLTTPGSVPAWRSIYVTTAVSFSIAIAPFPPVVHHLIAIQRWLHILPEEQTEQLFLMWTPILSLFLTVLLWERRSLKSFGVRTPKALDLPLGIAVFIAINYANFASSRIVAMTAKLGHSQVQTTTLLAHSQWWLVVWAFYAAIFEELYFRGYAIERVGEISGSLVVGAVFGLVMDFWVHVPYWGLTYVFGIACGQLLLALLYLWRRSVVPGLIAHLLWDLPLLPFIPGWFYATASPPPLKALATLVRFARLLTKA
jgi:membrane protease YdiL (CAAX protease family)